MDAAGWGATEAESAQSAAQLPFTFLLLLFLFSLLTGWNKPKE